MKSPKDPGVVGLRASWTCAFCRKVARTYQLVLLADPQLMDLPPGWIIVKNLAVCGEHFAERPQDAVSAI